MIEPRFLQALFVDTYDAIKRQVEGITHSDSVRQPPQDQLLTALSRVSAEDLCTVKGDQSIGEHLISYHAHESYHLGQLELLRQLIGKETSV